MLEALKGFEDLLFNRQLTFMLPQKVAALRCDQFKLTSRMSVLFLVFVFIFCLNL